MTLKDLVENTDWRDVKARLLDLYPDEEKSMEGYEAVFAALSALIPQPTPMRIVLEKVVPEEREEEPFVDVSGKDGTLHRDLPEFGDPNQPEEGAYACLEVSFGLEFTAWEEWLGMQIDPSTRQQFSDLDILAHGLWEMTFMGFDQATIRERREDLERSVRELDRMTPEERREKLIPLEDLEKEIEEDEPYGADQGSGTG